MESSDQPAMDPRPYLEDQHRYLDLGGKNTQARPWPEQMNVPRTIVDLILDQNTSVRAKVYAAVSTLIASAYQRESAGRSVVHGRRMVLTIDG